MNHRYWLAGVAAVTFASTLPASAQAPRSLFEASPAPVGGTPVTMGFQPVAPTKPQAAAPAPSTTSLAARAPEVPMPKEAKPVATRVSPATKPAASAPALDADKPAIERREAARPRRDRQFAARSNPSELPPPPGVSQSSALPTTTAPIAEAKPMSRSERRRAAREAKRQAATQAVAPASAAPAAPANPLQSLFAAPQPSSQPTTSYAAPASAGRAQIDALVSHHARLNNVPESLVHRVIVRESKYNPRAVGRGGAMGLMQIKTATARGVGYSGGPAGLLDAETNITYAVKYLAGAWRVSGGSHDRAVMHYARGYYYEARRLGHAGPRGRRGQPEPAIAAAAPAQTPSLFSLFSQPNR